MSSGTWKNAQITGKFAEDEAADLARVVNAGSLPFLMHAENGKYRARLLRYVAAFRTDEAARTMVERAGFTEAELRVLQRQVGHTENDRFAPGYLALFETHIGKIAEIEPAWRGYVQGMK